MAAGEISGNLAAALLACISTLLVVYRGRSFAIAALPSVAIHLVIGYINAFISPTLGANKDARVFHEQGVAIAAGFDIPLGIGSFAYSHFLGLTYTLLGSSEALGISISILIFVCNLIYIQRFCNLFQLANSGSVIFAFSMLPTLLLLTSITLRESMEMFFFCASVYHMLAAVGSTRAWHHRWLFLIFSIFLGFTHKGLAVFSLGLILLALTLWMRDSPQTRHRGDKASGPRAASVVIGIVAIGTTLLICTVLAASVGGNLINFAAEFRGNTAVARASYGVDLDISSIGTAVSSVSTIVFYYFAAPLRIQSLVDLYAMAEAQFRIVLLIASIVTWRMRRAPGIGLVLAAGLCMDVLWALGTTNYGTAMRHKLVAYWVYCLLGVPAVAHVWRTLITSLATSRDGVRARTIS